MISAIVKNICNPFFRQFKKIHNFHNTSILILIYHRVTTLDSDPQMLAVSPENFFHQMQYLKNNFNICRIEDDFTSMPKPGVIITFDDGYADNCLEALPILSELQIPATFFVSTSLIGTQHEFWWDELERIILGGSDFHSQFELNVPVKRVWKTDSQAAKRKLYKDMHPILKNMLPEGREDVLNELRQWALSDNFGRASHRVMTTEELLHLSRSPYVTIGAHTENHCSLSSLPFDRQLIEIVDSKEKLETIIGKEISVFSYPFGTKNDFTAETIELCKRAGFSRATVNWPGQWRATTDSLTLPRNLVRNWNVDRFVEEVEGFWTA